MGGAGFGLDLTLGTDGELYAAGGYYGTMALDSTILTANGTGSDVLLTKMSGTGEVLWATGFGGTSFLNDYDEGKHIGFDPLHNRIVVGGSISTLFTIDTIAFNGSTTSANGNSFLAGFDTDGNIQWGRALACGSGFVLLDDMDVSNTGVTYGFGFSSCQTTAPGTVPESIGPGGFIVKYSSDGELIDAETPAQASGIAGMGWFSSSEWLLVGTSEDAQATIYGQPISLPAGQLYAGYIARTDTLGNVAWSHVLESSVSSTSYACAYAPNGSAYVLGSFRTDVILGNDTLRTTPGTTGHYITALNPQGVFQWSLAIKGTTSSDRKIGLASDGSIYLSGNQFGDSLQIGSVWFAPMSGIDHFVAHIGTQGQVLGVLRTSNSNSDYAAVLPTTDAVYLSFVFDSSIDFVDTTLANPGGTNGSFLVAKLGELNWTTSIRSMESTSGELHIYANPNNGLCTIDLPEELRLTDDLMLSVFDNTGQLVQRVPLRYSEQGVRLDIRAQARGIYHVELGDGQQRYTGTIVFE